MNQQDQTIVRDTGKPPKKKQTTIILIILAAVLVACLCVLSSAAVVYFDPFNLGLVGRLRGGYDSITTTVPADTDIYISIDLLKFLSEDTRGVFDAFAKSSGDPEVTNREEFIQQMDDTLMEEFGVTFSADIQPWIGQYMGLSFFDVSPGEYGEPVFDHWIFVVEARNKKDADAFIAKLVTHISAETGKAFAEHEHKGTVIHELVTEYDYERIVFARKSNLFFISSSAENIINAIDAQSGENLAKNESFKAVTSQLPTTRLMTAYISQSFFELSTAMIEEDLLDSFSLPANLHNLGMALSLVNEGVKIDFAAIYDLNSLSQAQIETLSSPGATGIIAEEVPSGAIGFVTGKDLGKVWDYIRGVIQESSGADSGEFNESMQLLEEEIGINPDRDLFPLLDQEWGIAILRERDTILAEQIDIPLGLLAIAGSGSPDQLNQSVQNMTDKMSGLGLVMIDKNISEKMTYYELQTFLFGEPLLAFGVKESQLFLSTSPIHLESNLDPADSLANDSAYQASWQPFANNMNPILFFNIRQLFTMIPDLNSDELGVLQPVQTIALAGSPLDGNIKQWVLMIYLETQ